MNLRFYLLVSGGSKGIREGDESKISLMKEGDEPKISLCCYPKDLGASPHSF